jgi:hypothetical protein
MECTWAWGFVATHLALLRIFFSSTTRGHLPSVYLLSGYIRLRSILHALLGANQSAWRPAESFETPCTLGFLPIQPPTHIMLK